MPLTAADRWRAMQDAARGQAVRLGDPGWTAEADAYAGRVNSFRAGQRTDDNLVDLLAARAGQHASVLEIGAGAGRLSLPLARRVRDVLALEPSPTMAEALEADAAAAGVNNLRVMRAPWETLTGPPCADAAFAAHVVYALARIDDFVLRVQGAAREWCAIILFADPPQSRLFDIWTAMFGEPRLPNPALPQLLDVIWSLGIYPEVTMLEVPVWPLGPPERARAGLRRRLHVTPGSAADARLDAVMAEHLVTWEEGVLGPADRSPLKLGVVHWAPTHDPEL